MVRLSRCAVLTVALTCPAAIASHPVHGAVFGARENVGDSLRRVRTGSGRRRRSGSSGGEDVAPARAEADGSGPRVASAGPRVARDAARRSPSAVRPCRPGRGGAAGRGRAPGRPRRRARAAAPATRHAAAIGARRARPIALPRSRARSREEGCPSRAGGAGRRCGAGDARPGAPPASRRRRPGGAQPQQLGSRLHDPRLARRRRGGEGAAGRSGDPPRECSP
jgi:hypothetical protein